jgi:hypothetical protein
MLKLSSANSKLILYAREATRSKAYLSPKLGKYFEDIFEVSLAHRNYSKKISLSPAHMKIYDACHFIKIAISLCCAGQDRLKWLNYYYLRIDNNFYKL